MAFVSPSGRFHRAVSALKRLDSSVPTAFDEDVTGKGLTPAELANEFEMLWGEVLAAGCVSRNETVGDVATKDLKFFLLPFYESRALSRVSGNSSQLRFAALEMSKKFLLEFFELVRQLEVVKREELSLIEKELPSDPSARRMAKIENLKREKEERATLQILKTKAARARATDSNEDDAEAAERELTIAVLRLAAKEVAGLKRSIDEELKLLKFAIDSEAKGKDPVEESRKAISALPPPQSYQILDTRRYQQQNVFKPSHALPTYTVEEWGEIEAARMRETMRKEEAERRRKEAQGEVDSDNEDIQDQKTLEARNWDDWKDEHNKGSGNTLR